MRNEAVLVPSMKLKATSFEELVDLGILHEIPPPTNVTPYIYIYIYISFIRNIKYR